MIIKMANTTSLKCILCGRFVPISDFPDHIRRFHSVTTNPDLVVVVSSKSEDQLAELRELLASFIAELCGGGDGNNCVLCGEREEEREKLGHHLINHHAHSSEDTTFSQQLGLLPPERLRQLVALLDVKGPRQKNKTEYMEYEDNIKEEPQECYKCGTCDFQTFHPGHLTNHEKS